MSASGADGHPLPVQQITDVSAAPRGGPSAHIAESLATRLENAVPHFTRREIGYCLSHKLGLCKDWYFDRNAARHLTELHFTGVLRGTDNHMANAFTHTLWTAFMVHSGDVAGDFGLNGFTMAKYHEYTEGIPNWESLDPIRRIPSLMDLHNDFAGFRIAEAARGHNEHYICSKVMQAIRNGKRLKPELANFDGRYVTEAQPYWIQRWDRAQRDAHSAPVLVRIKEETLPEDDCG